MPNLILPYLSTVRADPGNRNKLPIIPFVEPLHLVCAIRVLAELVLDVHERCTQLWNRKR